MSTKIQVRRGTALQWSTANPTLDPGEIGFETDTGKLKIGPATATAWNSLIYVTDTTDFVGLLTGAQGGTGIANTGKTITVSGNTVIGSSTHTVTLNTGANTTLTLPTAGTLLSTSAATAVTNFALRDTSAAFDVTLAATSSTALTAGRTFTLDMVNAARTVKLGGNLTLANNFITAGNFATTLTSTAITNATLPAGTVTLADTTSAQVISGKTSYNGLALTAQTTGFTVAGGSSTSKTLTVNNAYTLSGSDATVSLAGNLTTAAALTQAGAFATTLTSTATTNATLPAGTVTLADLGTAQAMTGQKTLTTPKIAATAGTASSGLVDYNGEVFRLTNTNTTAAQASIYAPYWVVSSTATGAIATTTAVNLFTTNQQTLTLENNKAYYFKLLLSCTHTYTAAGTFNLIANFSQTPQSISYIIAYHGNASITSWAGQTTVATTSAITPTLGANSNSTIIIEGTFLSNATTGGTLGFQGAASAGTTISTVVKAGSQMQIMKIGTSATGAISGTFA